MTLTFYFGKGPRLSAMTLVLLLAGCAMGPDFHSPSTKSPADFNALHSTEHSQIRSAAPNPEWWKSFNDPQLNTLIEQAIRDNLSLKQAVLRIAGARAQLSQVKGGFFPSVNGSAGITRQQPGLKGQLESHGVYDQVDDQTAGQLNSLTQPVTLYQGKFDASWELDLWGKVRRQTEMAEAQQQASIESSNDALVSVEAEVVRTYFQLRGAQAVTATLQQQIDVARQTLTLTQSQHRSGMAAETDVENARAQLSSLKAQRPGYLSQEHQAMNALAVLTGKVPGALNVVLGQARPLPQLPHSVAVGVPSSLVRRRPDIRQAEARLHAQTANIGISIASLFPDLTLTGELGVRNTDASYLDNWSSHFYSFGPSLSVPVFHGGRLVAGVKLARAQQAEAALAWRQSVLTALQDVENALVSYRADQQQLTELDQTTAALQRAFDLASDSYRQGLSSFLGVLDTQRQLAQAEQQAIQARAQSMLDLVALYKALGGGWELQQNRVLPDYDVFGPATPVN